MRNLALVLLALWLIAYGLLPFLKVPIRSFDVILNVLAIAAGILLLINRESLRLPRNIGVILLSLWLILMGALPLLNIRLPSGEIILALLAVAAGIFLLLKRKER